MKTKRTVDTCEDDQQFVRWLEEQITSLCGCVIEATRTTPQLLLSQSMRELLAEKAERVQANFLKIKGRIAVDNPGQDISPSFPPFSPGKSTDKEQDR
jgi:hypothetical protein